LGLKGAMLATAAFLPSTALAQERAPAPVASGETPPPVSPAEARGQVWVHLDGPAGTRLEQAGLPVDGDDRWHPVCAAPCDIPLSWSASYRVAGAGRYDSRDFWLRPSALGRATVRARGGSISLYALGIVGLGTGAAAGAVGLYLEIVALAVGVPVGEGEGPGPSAQAQQKQFAEAGAILLASGAVVATVGALLMANNRHPTVDRDVTSPEVTTAVSLDGWKRAPTWRQEVPDPLRLPLVADVPLLTGGF
jgi:hypothetical protein